MNTDDSQGSRGREEAIFIPLPHPPTHENSDIYQTFAGEMTTTYF